ncbi:MAG TPA: glycosyltransferase family 4 protein [Planctomycetaceae bacterium]|nr:glycosyltransferase family 4 protein [Planctomycetaceae bacterium]
MHILFLTHYFPPEVNAPATRTWEHCRLWAAAGHRVTVITCVPNCPAGVAFDGYRNRWKTEEIVDGVRVIRVWTWLSANRGFFGRVLNYTSYLVRAVLSAVWLRNVDVVVATSPQFFCGWAGVLCRWIRRWPFVLEVRDLWPESIVTVGAMRKSWLTRLLEFLERRMYAAAGHVVTVGEGYRQKLCERGVPAGKVSVVPNGVDLDEFVPARRGPVPRSRPFVCGYLGTVGMAHGLEVVLEAAETLRQRGRHDVVFEIVGDGAERERLAEDAARRGLPNVRFAGLVPREQVPAVLSGFDAALVHLRGAELFGTVIPSKIFEAMALNVPIIMGVSGPACEIVQAAGAGVAMTPDDAGSLIECVERVQSNAALLRGGRRYVEQHFGRRELAERMLHVLEQITGRRRSEPEIIPLADHRPAGAEAGTMRHAA